MTKIFTGNTKLMNHFIFTFIVSVLATIHFSQAEEGPRYQPVTKEAFSIGDTLTFHSDILNEQRTLNIYLPPSWKADDKQSFPVIYLLDGSRDEDFIHISGLTQFASFSWINMMPESIVVGIANVDRKRDYTFPTRNQKDKADFPTTGGSQAFIQFLQQEVIPMVQNKYRATGEATLLGQSLGGLLATEVLLKQSSLFDNYLIVSPSLWWDDESLLGADWNKDFTKKKVFIAVGEEGSVMVRSARELFDKLFVQQNKPKKLGFKFLPEQNHGDALHLAAYEGFDFLFESSSREASSK